MTRELRVLVSGPADLEMVGLVRFFRDQGRNAVDANEVPGLVRAGDPAAPATAPAQGERAPPASARREWDASRLAELLGREDEIYLFGYASNIYDLRASFDRRFYLRPPGFGVAPRPVDPRVGTDPERHGPRVLRAPGGPEPEEERARRAGFRWVESGTDFLRIFEEICRPGVSKRRP